ncbi:MAG TPA: hypothetical protein HPQ04_10280 [Rhodospirillaceae bacterium]|nr:hypothetical protein [Rhodospirillaceae bacterium]
MKNFLILALLAGMAACVTPDGGDRSHGGGGGYYQPPPPSAPPPYYSGPALSDLQQKALADGCELRYSGNAHKLRECFNLGANWQDALAQGCQHRYSGVPHKLRECMSY